MDKHDNSPKAFEGLDEIFDVTPIPVTGVTNTDADIEVNNLPVESGNLTEDVNFVKSRLKELINTSNEFTQFAMSIAESTQDSKDMSVVLDSIKTQSSLLSKLISVQKKDPKPEEPGSTTITNNTVVFQGNANEALKQIRDKEK